MIRAACTWFLIVLAASPFTAPFSTCDLSALLGDRPATVVVASVAACADTFVAACADIGSGSDSTDAGSISPLVARVVLSRDTVRVVGIPPASDALLLPRFALVQPVRAVQDLPLQASVLRL